MTYRIHIDTDLGGDPDDACALAMLLGWPDVEITGVTTCLEVAGRRAGCAQHLLDLAARADIEVVAGAEASMTTQGRFAVTWGDTRYWPEPVAARPSPPGAALDLLTQSIASGATILVIGSSTNLALLEIARPGALSDAHVVAMGGWIDEPSDGFPSWGSTRDFNVQCDPRAAEIVFGATSVTYVTLPTSMRAHLRSADLPRLRASGPIGELLARQSEAYATDWDRPTLARAHPALPPDLLNFHWDPVAAAVAAGWAGVAVEDAVLSPEMTVVDDGTTTLAFVRSGEGWPHRVAVDLDVDGFREVWITAVETTDRRAKRPRVR